MLQTDTLHVPLEHSMVEFWQGVSVTLLVTAYIDRVSNLCYLQTLINLLGMRRLPGTSQHFGIPSPLRM